MTNTTEYTTDTAPAQAIPAKRHSIYHTDGNGKILPNLFNAKVVFTHSEGMRGCLGFDSFAHEAVWLKAPPWDPQSAVRAMTDNDVREALAWVLDTWQVGFPKAVVEDALLMVAHANPFHPVRDYINGLEWDGKPRIDSFLVDHLGAADNPLNRAYSAMTLIGAVARIMNPGCLLKTVLTLEGPQDIGKSSALRALMPRSAWFTDHVEEIGSKDARMQIRGVWLVEFAEFESLSRADVNKAKSFISSPSDRYRPPYERFTRDFPRECIFTISINPGANGYLKDMTGNVRYWIVECGDGWEADRKIDVRSIVASRDQLWAEAAVRYKAGEKWWLNDAALVAAQAEVNDARTVLDPWHDIIAEWVHGKPAVQIQDIMSACLSKLPGDQNRWHQMRVGDILTKLGWQRKLFRVRPGVRVWAYYLPGADDDGHNAALAYLREKTPALRPRLVTSESQEPTG